MAEDGDDYSKQLEEVSALAEIYGDSWQVEGPSSYKVLIPGSRHQLELSLTLPPNYPSSAPPSFLISAPWLGGEAKATIAEELHSTYRRFQGDFILLAWVERVRELLQDLGEHQQLAAESPVESAPLQEVQEDVPVIHSGEIYVDRKSTFQAHLALVSSSEQVRRVVGHLKSNKKIAAATHNVMAYRFRTPQGTLEEDFDDDGEKQAGSRLLHLLQLSRREGLVIVVTRWFGGILLGPDRFKDYNKCAQDLLTAIFAKCD